MSKIPMIPVPLTSSSQANIPQDRKRRSAETCSSPDAKRRIASSAHGLQDESEKTRVSVDEDFQAVFAATGLTAEEILAKKVNFKKRTPPEKKLEEILPLLKHLRAVGKCLLKEKEECLQKQVQLEQQVEDVRARLDRKEADWSARQERHEEYVQQINELVSTLEKEKASLQSETEASWANVATKDTDIARLNAEVSSKQEQMDGALCRLAEKDSKCRELEAVLQQAQAYSSTLQQYNTTLQADVNVAKEQCQELQLQRDLLQKQLASAEGTQASLTSLLNVEKEQVCKLRDEREAASRDAAVLRGDLEAMRQERDRLASDVSQLREEVDRHKIVGSKTSSKAENLAQEKVDLVAKVQLQAGLLDDMRGELALVRAQTSVTADEVSKSYADNNRLQAELASLKAALEQAEQQLHNSDVTRRKLHNVVQDLKGNIRVFCRVRPAPAEIMSPIEYGSNGAAVDRSLTLTVATNSSQSVGTQKHPFTFDKVFGAAASQECVYEEVSELVQSALDGRKVCIFAYGQTGSGKTHTMMGDAANQGIIPRAIHQVFSSSKRMEAQGWQFTMTASMLEIYNDEYRDLLPRKRSADAKKHQVVHEPNGYTTVTDLTQFDVSRAERVGELLQEAMTKRSVGCTAMNEQSSRSHMVFTLRIEGHNPRTGTKLQGVLNLIDLAGSERVKDSGAVGARLKEAQSINKSLSALGDVIVALSQKAEHVPFRNSKLTWLLQPCLGGDAKTLMFVNINPTSEYVQESLCSLRFALKVNSVVTATHHKRLPAK